jgi:hypothetical protein
VLHDRWFLLPVNPFDPSPRLDQTAIFEGIGDAPFFSNMRLIRGTIVLDNATSHLERASQISKERTVLITDEPGSLLIPAGDDSLLPWSRWTGQLVEVWNDQ